ncbi:MAG TPA: hypothetical protein VEF04_02640, partial [Blastocatellia bacterium]|nr:hypothetical protein [Blastocatellia bacterium]
TLDRDASFRTCRCGFHKHDHIHVVPKCKYKWHAILRLLIGATAYPYEVRYVCERCNETIETTRDIEVLKTHV